MQSVAIGKQQQESVLGVGGAAGDQIRPGGARAALESQLEPGRQHARHFRWRQLGAHHERTVRRALGQDLSHK